MRLSMGSQFFLNSGVMIGANQPSMMYESMDNLYMDPYIGENPTSFSNRPVRTPFSSSLRQPSESISLFPTFGIGESQSNDWGQSNVGTPLVFNDQVAMESAEKIDRESGPDPSFFGQFEISPPLREEVDAGNGRKSVLSATEPDCMYNNISCYVVNSLRYSVSHQPLMPSILQKPSTSSLPIQPSKSLGSHVVEKGNENLTEELQVKSTYSEDKKRLKLERNRESARKSRKRRKQYQQLLDNKVDEILRELVDEKTNRLSYIQTSYKESIERLLDHSGMPVFLPICVICRKTKPRNDFKR